jgi:hypothetical protein
MKYIIDTFIQNIRIRLVFIKANKVAFLVRIVIIFLFIAIFGIFIYAHKQDIYAIFEGIFIPKKEIIPEPKPVVAISLPKEKVQSAGWFDWSSYSTKQKILIGVGVTSVTFITGVTIYYVCYAGGLSVIGGSIGKIIPVIGGSLSAMGGETISNSERTIPITVRTTIPITEEDIFDAIVDREDLFSQVEEDLPLHEPYPYTTIEEEDLSGLSSIEESVFDMSNTADIQMQTFIDFLLG